MQAEPEFGIYIPQIVADYGTLLDLARTAERTGFGTLWLFDHLYSPGLPDHPALEAWTTATALLAGTTSLRVGALVLCNNFRHPVLLGRMATTLDLISGGRLAFGVGSGSIADEHRKAGLPWGSAAERSERLGEALEIITRMFTGDHTSFEGRHYRVTDIPNSPKPLQRPRPPIHIGGAGPKYTIPLVARYADVWNVPTYGLRDWVALTAALEAECARIDRDPSTIRRSHQAVLAVAPRERGLPELRARVGRRFADEAFGVEEGYIGTPAMLVDRLGERARQGISSFVFMIGAKQAAATMELFATEVMPQL
ncbi:LLM class flavin-dependent oxidoreductase [Nocardia sp. CDC186]|uniref:LLM class flavin-dependent oxidoreductase n=1 Tax=Nocardia implantans TaxID=3108168 RepID=A0ABU6AVU5_9NOCA|nr:MULTISPECIES: LLM class flavin-dependent oxidoreductase [unclassified Nocardia]MEA3527710.1 LLM class flavin-dependent oxidoreductase [Nocardia sp. CDC192]MEB3511418.1 LLM class flavin-dependent oxidoreductase [Nocardia sp. CDC186]